MSDEARHHFSWSDWMGLTPKTVIPQQLRTTENGTDTIHGKYSPTEVWIRNNDKIKVKVNVLADTTSRRWVPNIAGFFRKQLDFESFKADFDYDNVVTDTISAMNLAGYSFNIESNGRGHEMFRFNRVNEPFFVSTMADVYILDKEYITVKEARKWEKRKFDTDETAIFEPLQAPPLPPSTLALIERVNNIEKDSVRLKFEPEYGIISLNNSRRNFRIGHRVLALLKQVTGITSYRSHKNFNNNWREFKNEVKGDTTSIKSEKSRDD